MAPLSYLERALEGYCILKNQADLCLWFLRGNFQILGISHVIEKLLFIHIVPWVYANYMTKNKK
jgi:hypothetical protein